MITVSTTQREKQLQWRVAFFCIPSGYGGSEIHTIKAAKVFAELGYAVTILEINSSLYTSASALQGSPVRVLKFDTDRPTHHLSVFDWRRLLPREMFDCIVLVKGHITVGSLALDLALRSLCRSLLVIEHSTPAAVPPNTGRPYFGVVPRLGLWRWKAKWRARVRQYATTKTVCVCVKAKESLVNNYGFNSKRIEVIYNGVDVGAHGHAQACRSSVLDCWGVPKNAFVFGAVGRLSEEKNYLLALKAFREMLDRRPNDRCYLVVVGDGAQRELLKSTASELCIADRVIMPGFLDDPSRAYAAFDAYLITSHTEGLPLALLEAMAMGCVPISTSVGGIPEVVEDETDGFLVPAADSQAMSAAMLRYFEMTDGNRQRMSEAAKEKVYRSFNASLKFRELAKLASRSQVSRTLCS